MWGWGGSPPPRLKERGEEKGRARHFALPCQERSVFSQENTRTVSRATLVRLLGARIGFSKKAKMKLKPIGTERTHCCITGILEADITSHCCITDILDTSHRCITGILEVD